ncbi:DUF6497 family protein [Roseovarius sp. SYSU LYC5161]|jgi:hypothetical protein|uniref:DUF6497 family protein n=1 Tax=Roseovarius halophilus (ex Wu et al. 2025) TaxID=3376060 RepID=UPI00399A350B
MIRPFLSALMLVAAPAVAAQDVAVPSGQPLELMELRLDEAQDMARFRFLAPELAARSFAEVADDFAVLCADFARPALDAEGIAVEKVVISLSAQKVPFGEPAPDVTQFFEVFRLSNTDCIWEYF